MNAVKREHNGKKIVEFKRLPASISWCGSTLEFYAIVDDFGEKMVCPVPFAESKSDMFEKLCFDDYGNLKYMEHYLDNSLIRHEKFVEYLQGE